MFVLGWLLVLLVEAVVLTNAQAYANLYTTLLRSSNLPTAPPSLIAPFRPPWPANDPEAAMQQYRQAVYNHGAYISPLDGEHHVGLRDRANGLIHGTGGWTNRLSQEELLDAVEAAATQARREILTALHPANVGAQHVEALRRVDGRLRGFLSLMSSGDNYARLTNRLGQWELERFVNAHRLLSLESAIINAAIPAANHLPHNL